MLPTGYLHGGNAYRIGKKFNDDSTLRGVRNWEGTGRLHGGESACVCVARSSTREGKLERINVGQILMQNSHLPALWF